jgi:hypothetical protein
MIKTPSKQTGSIHMVVIIILILALVGVLGFIFWQNFMQSPKADKDAQANQTDSLEKPSDVCVGYGDAVEKNKVFCSKNVGVEFKIPEVFVNKFQKKENYDVFKGGMDDAQGTLAGKSLEYYEATVASGEETLLLSVAKEPSRSGYSSVSDALQRTYFNETNGNLFLVNGPVSHYDSKTGMSTTTGGWSAGKTVPSFDVNGTKVYHGKVGDAGIVEDDYLTVVSDGIVVIKIKHTANPMDTPALNVSKSFTDLDTYLKQIKFLGQ